MNYSIEFEDPRRLSLRVWDDAGRLVREAPRIFSTEEACRLLRRSRRHLYRWVARGWLRPVTKFSGELFFRGGASASSRARAAS